MPEMYRTAPLQLKDELAALVVHCSDPRFQPHFQEFLEKGLGIRRYSLIAVPGGAQFLTLVDYLPKFSWVGWRWMKFMTDLTRPDQLVLIAHEDCRWYLDARFAHDSNVGETSLAADNTRKAYKLRERVPKPIETHIP